MFGLVLWKFSHSLGRFSTHGKYLSLGCVGYSVECLYLRDSFPRLMNLHILAHLGLVLHEGSCFTLKFT